MSGYEMLLYDATLSSNEKFIRYLLDDEIETKVAAAAVLVAGAGSFHSRRALYCRQQLNWEDHVERLRLEAPGAFHRTYRMPEATFAELAALLADPLAKQERQAYASSGHGAVTVETSLHCALRWLAGAQVPDLVSYSGLSQSSVYKAIHTTTKAICQHDALAIYLPRCAEDIHAAAEGFRAGSHGDLMKGCVLAVDGWLCPIQQPGEREADGAVRCYFSGHYQRFGVNVQVAVDHRGRFVWVDVAGPGSTNDVTAYEGSALQNYVESLPIGYYGIGDNAYMPTEHFLTPFSGCQKGNPPKSAFNYCLSQQRIKVEMALGRLVAKFRIFRSPLQIALKHVGRTVIASCCVHNYLIDKQVIAEQERGVIADHQRGIIARCDTNGLHSLPYLSSDTVISRRGNSTLRQHLLDYVRDNNIQRPDWNVERNADRLLD
eukprot:GHVU01112628.1.p1 GENE.GHVU01112628.1~~GHVU01112628.1.p1  ORF type:complete len:433 (-),score=43.14 GHVU01112628.1:208-1506(-)